MSPVGTITALVIETERTMRVAALPVDDYWTSRRVQNGRAAALDAVEDVRVAYYALGDTPGLACLAAGANHLYGDRPINTLANEVLAAYGKPGDVPIRGRAVILAGSELAPRPIPPGAANELAQTIRTKLADVTVQV